MKLSTPIAEGNTARIYLSHNRIIKVFKNHLPDTEAAYEAEKQKQAYSAGLNVPEVYEVTKIDGKQAIIMAYIKGKTLGELLLEDMDKAEYYMALSVEIQQHIHSITSKNLEKMPDKLKRQIESAHTLNDSQRAALIQKLDAMRFEERLCHGDFHLFNLIASDDSITIIDWVDSSAGDIRADVYRTYLLYQGFSTDLAKLYLKLYCRTSGLSEAEVVQWAPLIAGARLAEGVKSEEDERLVAIVNDLSCNDS